MTHLAQDAESGRRDEGGEPFADPQGRQSAVPSGGHRISARGSRGSRGARAINAQELLERDERAAKPGGFSRGCKQRTYVRGGIPCTSGRGGGADFRYRSAETGIAAKDLESILGVQGNSRERNQEDPEGLSRPLPAVNSREDFEAFGVVCEAGCHKSRKELATPERTSLRREGEASREMTKARAGDCS